MTISVYSYMVHGTCICSTVISANLESDESGIGEVGSELLDVAGECGQGDDCLSARCGD